MSVPQAEDVDLAMFLAARDVACPACGYNLRGLSTQHCPECRQQLVLSVGLAEPPIVQFALATIGLAICGAGAATWLLIISFMMLTKGGLPRTREVILMIAVPAVIVVVDLILVVSFVRENGRRQFRTRSRKARSVMVAVCWAISVVTITMWIIALIAVL